MAIRWRKGFAGAGKGSRFKTQLATFGATGKNPGIPALNRTTGFFAGACFAKAGMDRRAAEGGTEKLNPGKSKRIQVNPSARGNSPGYAKRSAHEPGVTGTWLAVWAGEAGRNGKICAVTESGLNASVSGK
jgi:hypothetical protein